VCFICIPLLEGNFDIRCFPQVRIARIFNTYGPRMCLDDGRVVSNFVAQVCLKLWFSISNSLEKKSNIKLQHYLKFTLSHF
jgi:hypothetical protein